LDEREKNRSNIKRIAVWLTGTKQLQDGHCWSNNRQVAVDLYSFSAPAELSLAGKIIYHHRWPISFTRSTLPWLISGQWAWTARLVYPDYNIHQIYLYFYWFSFPFSFNKNRPACSLLPDSVSGLLSSRPNTELGRKFSQMKWID